jgi:hypothetical protein
MMTVLQLTLCDHGGMSFQDWLMVGKGDVLRGGR